MSGAHRDNTIRVRRALSAPVMWPWALASAGLRRVPTRPAALLSLAVVALLVSAVSWPIALVALACLLALTGTGR